jgi:hypothetical protein
VKSLNLDTDKAKTEMSNSTSYSTKEIEILNNLLEYLIGVAQQGDLLSGRSGEGVYTYYLKQISKIINKQERF